MGLLDLIRGKVEGLTACLVQEWIADVQLDYLVVSGWIEFVDNFIGRCSGNDAP
ncbi:hypothetical protein D3C84_1277770 [compost metagenome]|jgi:hypothetical protein